MERVLRYLKGFYYIRKSNCCGTSPDVGSPFTWVRNISTWRYRSRRRLFSPESRLSIISLTILTLVITLICFLSGSPALAEEECGEYIEHGGGTITCDASTYNGDGGIEYVLGNGDWIINLEDDLNVNTEATEDHALRISQAGAGSLTINMLGASLTTEGTSAHSINVTTQYGGLVKIKMSGGEIKTS